LSKHWEFSDSSLVECIWDTPVSSTRRLWAFYLWIWLLNSRSELSLPTNNEVKNSRNFASLADSLPYALAIWCLNTDIDSLSIGDIEFCSWEGIAPSVCVLAQEWLVTYLGLNVYVPEFSSRLLNSENNPCKICDEKSNTGKEFLFPSTT
jgi:hypothetical protein